MEAEEQKHDAEEEVKIPKRAKLTAFKIKEMSSRMLAPVVEEQKAIDMRRVIRAIKDPDSIIKGTKQQKLTLEEELGPQPRKKSIAEKRDSLHSLYKLPGTDIILKNAQADSIGFLECMSGPRLPNFDETESDTTFERLSNDSESEETPSILELLKSESDENETEEKPEKRRIGCKKAAEIANEEKEDDKKPGLKKPKLKRWKPRVKQTSMIPDPILTEYAQGVTDYLNEIGIFNFMKEWLYHLYGTNPKPEDPVKLLRKYIADSLGNSEQESGDSNLEKELRTVLKQEDEILVEISKLNHLAHLLAPEIYDADGNIISYEPSVEEEEKLIHEEESAIVPSVENVVKTTTNVKVRKAASKTRTVAKKGKRKPSGLSRVQSKSKTSRIKKSRSVLSKIVSE